MSSADALAAAPRRAGVAQALWILGPFAAFLLVLQRLWYDAPVWDDYDTVLGLLLRADEVRTPGEWLRMIFGLHNEHRIAVTRLVVLGLARAFGEIDFRVLMLLGNATLLGTFAFMWREFRAEVPPSLFGAAALVMFQWSYYEASVMGSAALPHLGVVFFAFGGLYFALRAGAGAAALAALLGVLAAASQANGLFALPLAALGCALWGSRRRAAFLGLLAVAAWASYFTGYARPGNHPSPLVALADPLATVHLFFVVVGGILTGTRWSALLGVAIVAGLAWTLAGRGLWRRHPVVVLWVAFELATAAAAAVGRVGFGVAQASRYAIGSTCLLVLLMLCVFSLGMPRSRPGRATAIAAAALVSVGVSYLVWAQVAEYSLRGKLLRETTISDPSVAADRFGGAFYPDPNLAHQVLARAVERGYYRPPRQALHGLGIVAAERPPASQRDFGHIDTAVVSGSRLVLTGWTDIPATVPSRTLLVASVPGFRQARHAAVVSRQDVAFAHGRADLVFAGFRVELDYGSEAEARQAAQALCAVVRAPGRPATRLHPAGPGCA